jgi:hypothetical protein
MTQSPHSDRQRRRKEMTDDIIQRVRDAVQEKLADAPDPFRSDDLDAIEDTVLAHTRQVVDALSIEEMGSEGALLSHIANARWETQRLMRERPPTGGPVKTI